MKLRPGKISREQAFEMMASFAGLRATEIAFKDLSNQTEFWVNKDGLSFWLNDLQNPTYEGDIQPYTLGMAWFELSHGCKNFRPISPFGVIRKLLVRLLANFGLI